MRVEFLTQEDPLYILPLFESFITKYSRHWQIVRVSCCRTMGNRSRTKLVRELIQLYGRFGFARIASRVAISRTLGLLALPAGAPRYYSLSQLCGAYEISCGPVENPNSDAF